MDIALYHKHFEAEHLEAVKAKMQTLGAPVIRAIWAETYGVWMAVEGCHRIRAAKALGLTPTIKDISAQKYASIQVDGESKRVSVAKLTAELEDGAPMTELIEFAD